MREKSRASKWKEPPRWLFWVFMACIGALMFRPLLVSAWTLVPLILANVIYRALESRASRGG